MPIKKTAEENRETTTYTVPERTLDRVPPKVISTKEAANKISKPMYRLNRSPARNASDTPAESTR